jgi:predicted Rossmann-fold nucleotide-binding protein
MTRHSVFFTSSMSVVASVTGYGADTEVLEAVATSVTERVLVVNILTIQRPSSHFLNHQQTGVVALCPFLYLAGTTLIMGVFLFVVTHIDNVT